MHIARLCLDSSDCQEGHQLPRLLECDLENSRGIRCKGLGMRNCDKAIYSSPRQKEQWDHARICDADRGRPDETGRCAPKAWEASLVFGVLVPQLTNHTLAAKVLSAPRETAAIR